MAMVMAFMALPIIAENVKVVSVTNQYGQDLVDATLKVNDGENLEDGDIVTHIYVTFDQELATKAKSSEFQNFVTIKNTVTGASLGLNKYSCGYKGSDKTTLDIFLSSDSYINTPSAEGVYSVEIKEGLGANAAGDLTEAYSFSFTYALPTAVSTVNAATPSSVQAYDLQGRRVNASQSGLLIIGGKKYSK